MTKIKCDYCNKFYSNNSNYRKHLLTKKHLNNCRLHKKKNETLFDQNETLFDPIETLFDPNETLLDQIETQNHDKNLKKRKETKEKDTTCKSNNCDYCKKKFNNKSHLRRHLKYNCHKIPNELKIELLTKHNNNKKTKHKIEITQNNIQNNTNNIQNNTNHIQNNTNNIQNNNIQNNNIIINTSSKELIELFKLSEETADHLTEEDKLNILNKPNYIIANLLDKIYENPSNHNIYVKNKRNQIYTYIDPYSENVKSGTKQTVIPMIYNQNMYHLDCFFDDLNDKLSNMIIKKIKYILNLYQKEDYKFMNRLKKEIELKIIEITENSKDKVNNFIEITKNNRKKFYYNPINNAEIETCVDNEKTPEEQKMYDDILKYF
jgi:hypothetical protein